MATLDPRTTARLTVRDPADEPIWISDANEDYHLVVCRRLQEPSQSMTLRDVVDKYIPCPHCKPPVTLSALMPTDPRYPETRDRIARQILATRTAAFERQQAVLRLQAEKQHQTEQDRNERSAQSALRLAKKLMESDRLTAARWLTNLIRDYPDTDAADQARTLLAQIE